VLIALNVALAAAVLLLMRRARAQAKAAKHTQWTELAQERARGWGLIAQ
jgi:hypothetical protein